jgi:hypothetical protein
MNLMRVFSVLAVMVVLNNTSFANTYATNPKNSFETESVSDFDEAEIYTAFSEIDDLVNYLSDNNTETYTDIQIENSSLLSSVIDNSDIAFNQGEKFSFNKQTAFLMGCAFGVLGIAAVAIVNNGDRERLNNSIWGCVTSSCVAVLPAIVFVLFYFEMFAENATYY